MTDTFEPIPIGKIDEGEFLPSLDLYMVDLPSTIEKIYNYRVSNGLSLSENIDEFYFLAPNSSLGTKSITTTQNNSALFTPFKSGEEPIVLWKAYYHTVAKFCVPMNPNEMDQKTICDLRESATFILPKIPAEMVAKLDTFFRTVDKENHSEAIVVLTYDFNYRYTDHPEVGWGFVVPPQKNNSVHCHYEKSDIIPLIPAGTEIVGTVHSHPGMDAYASQTDHQDQAGNDGIHITFGWKSSKGNKTEYYAEICRGNNFYRVDPEVVMDLNDMEIIEVTIGDQTFEVDLNHIQYKKREFEVDKEELDTWLSKVEKSSTQYWQNKGTTGGGTPKVITQGGTNLDISSFFPESAPKGIPNFGMENYPDPSKNNIFISVKKQETICPMCYMSWKTWAKHVIERRQCPNCASLFLVDQETVEDADRARQQQNFTPLVEFIDHTYPFVLCDGYTQSWHVLDVEIDHDAKLLKDGGGTPKVNSGSN